MRRFVPILLACCLIPGAHAAPPAAPASESSRALCPPAPVQVKIEITEVRLPAGVPATFTQVKDPATGAPNDLLALQQAAAKTKVTLTLTPGPTLTTTDGVTGTLNNRTMLPYTGTDAAGKKQKFFQSLDNGLSARPHINADGTITVDLSVTDSQVSGPPTTPDGPSPTTTQSFSTFRTFANGQTKNISTLDITARSMRVVFATVTLVPPAKP